MNTPCSLMHTAMEIHRTSAQVTKSEPSCHLHLLQWENIHTKRENVVILFDREENELPQRERKATCRKQQKTQALLCGAKSHPRALPNHWVSCELMPSHSLLDEWDCLAYTLTRTHLKNPHPSGTNSSMFIDVKPPSYNHTHPSILSQQCNF